MLHTKCQDSMHCAFRQEDFLKFHFENLFSPCDLDVQGLKPFEHLLNRGHIRIIPAMFV